MTVQGVVDVQQLVCATLHDGLHTLSLAGIGGGRLSAAADAAVRTGHDLDEVEVLFAALDLFDQLVGIAEAVGHGDLQGQITGGHAEGLDALEAADTALGDGLQGVGRRAVQHVADDRLGHAARDAEDDTGTGVIAQRIIRLGIGQVLEVDTGRLDQLAELVGGQDEVDETLAVLHELGALRLELLGGRRPHP